MKNIIKKIFTILFCTLFLASCGGKAHYNKCVNHLKSHMKDPSSLIVSSATGYEDDGYISFKIYYDGKNSFGAYTGMDVIYVCIRPTGEVQCSHCEVLAGDSAFYYSIGSISGEQIYSK